MHIKLLKLTLKHENIKNISYINKYNNSIKLLKLKQIKINKS